MKGVALALILMLLHSFFSCESAPFQVPDNNHAGFSHQSHFESTNQDVEHNQGQANEHEVHAHLSCHSGYGINLNWPVTDKVIERVVSCSRYYLPLRYPPPVPPPNLSFPA